MAQLVKRENDLVAIKVRLTRSGDVGVVFDVERAGETLSRVEVDPRQLGAPPDLDVGRYAYGEPEWVLPPDVLNRLREGVTEAYEGEPVRAVWLHLAPPSGFLTLLPWERLLAPFEAPVLRVPNFASFPPLDTSDLDIAVCVSQPLAKGQFDGAAAVSAIAAAFTAEPRPLATVHVFSDRPTHERLARAADLPDRVVLHDPADAPESPRTPVGAIIEDTPDMAWNPWLHWIAHELAHRSVEVVHFVTHTYATRNQGALAVAESPLVNVDRQWSRFIGPQQLITFLDHVGAWAVGISQPEHSFSPMGARLLIDDLAHRRAGPIVLHDLGSDPEAASLAGIWRSLSQSEWPHGPSDVAVYAHPRQFREPSDADRVPFAETLLAEPRRSAAASSDQPAWVTVTRRYLEQSAARLFPETEQPTSDAQIATGEGVRQAVAFVDKVIEAYGGSSAAEASVSVSTGDEAERPESAS